MAQFRHSDSVMARGRLILRERAPDVLEQILADGVEEMDLGQQVPGGVREPGDEELVFLRCRRPVFEGALRRAVEREPRVRVRPDAAVARLVAANDHPSGVCRVVGVRTRDGADLAADLVVVAAGRRAPPLGLLAEAGAAPPSEECEDAAMVYYGRSYRLSAEIDRSRTREWRGEAGGPPSEEDWPRFMRLVLLPASAKDPGVFRAVRRSMLLLDAPGALRRNRAVIDRARAVAAATAAEATPRVPDPTRDELLAAMRSAAQAVAA